MLLLDTCTLLWLAADPDRLSARARSLIAAARGSLFVSAISAFEIGVKHRKKGLVLALTPDAWYQRALNFHGIRELPVNGAIACRSAALPLHHRDPCDRIIVATAEASTLRVLTPDPLIRAYTEVAVEW